MCIDFCVCVREYMCKHLSGVCSCKIFKAILKGNMVNIRNIKYTV